MKNFKTDFEKWYCTHDGIIMKCGISIVLFTNFEMLPKSMQWGVYVDFFDSVGICIYIRSYNKQSIWRGHMQGRKTYKQKTRQEAREKALEKAIDLFCNQ